MSFIINVMQSWLFTIRSDYTLLAKWLAFDYCNFCWNYYLLQSNMFFFILCTDPGVFISLYEYDEGII